MKRIMIESDKCEGCKNCSIACMQAHRGAPGTIYDLDLTDPANETRNIIRLNSHGSYIPIFCRHCDEPECVNSCMSGALTKDAVNNHIRYDANQCGSCFMCVMNCPYGVLKPDHITQSFIIRCDFCVNDQEQPNCVKSCPKKAIHVEEVSP